MRKKKNALLSWENQVGNNHEEGIERWVERGRGNSNQKPDTKWMDPSRGIGTAQAGKAPKSVRLVRRLRCGRVTEKVGEGG